MANKIDKDTKVTIGTVVVIVVSLFTAYRGMRADIRAELDTKVDKAVYFAERQNTNARIESQEKQSLIRFDMIYKEMKEIKELIKEGK